MAAATPSKKVKTLTATPLMDKEDAPNTRGPVLRKPVVYTAADEDGVRGRGPVLPKPKALDSYDRGYTKNEESFDSKMNTDSWDDSMWAVEESELLQ